MAIGLIARRELTELWRDGRLRWAGGLVALLLAASLLTGWQRQSTLQDERAAAAVLDYDDWLAQGQRHPHDAAHQGMFVFKPEPPLSIFDPGVGPYVGSSQWLQAHRQSETRFRPAQDATGLQRFGSLSPAWVLQVLGPLLIVVLGFHLYATERELGTLRQTMSLGVSPATLFFGKALGLAAAVAMLLVPTGVIGAGLVLATAPAGDRVDALVRLLLLGLGYTAYLGLFLFVVLAVSARARSTRMALATLLALWMICGVVLPRVFTDLSARLDPTPTRTAFNARIDADLSEAQGRAWRENFGVAEGWGPDLPLNKWGIALAVNDRASYPSLDRNFAALWDTFERQQRTQEMAGFVAPVLAMRSFSMIVAGTDFAQHRHFSLAAERHRRRMQDLISQDLVEHADTQETGHFNYDAGPEFWAKVPPFRYQPPAAGSVLARSLPALAVLLVGLVAAAVIAFVVRPRRPVQP